jgi:hypothetical protein
VRNTLAVEHANGRRKTLSPSFKWTAEMAGKGNSSWLRRFHQQGFFEPPATHACSQDYWFDTKYFVRLDNYDCYRTYRSCENCGVANCLLAIIKVPDRSTPKKMMTVSLQIDSKHLANPIIRRESQITFPAKLKRALAEDCALAACHDRLWLSLCMTSNTPPPQLIKIFN